MRAHSIIRTTAVAAAVALLVLAAGCRAQYTTGRTTTNYRIVGGSDSTWGRLEMQDTSISSSPGPWGTVCGTSFDASAAYVACKSVGFPQVSRSAALWRTASSSDRPAASYPIHYRPRCSGTEDSISFCTSLSRTTCSHANDVILSCGRSSMPTSAVNASTPAEVSTSSWEYRLASRTTGTDEYGQTVVSGRLEGRPSSAFSWGNVCGLRGTGASSRVACTSLGLTSTGAMAPMVNSSQRGSSSVGAVMDNPRCSSVRDPSLDTCLRDSEATCGYTEAIWLQCWISSSSPATAAAPAVATTWEYRLIGGSDDSWGRLEVRPQGTTDWGTVCDDSFDANDAFVACRSLGQPDGTVSWRSARGPEQGVYGQPILLDDLACTGSERTLAECSRASGHNCGHYEDIVLKCGALSVPAPDATAPSRYGAAPAAVSRNITLEPTGGCDGTCATGVVFGLLTFFVPIGVLIGLFVFKGHISALQESAPFAVAAGVFVVVAFGPFVMYMVAFTNPGLEYLSKVQETQAAASRNASAYDPAQHTSCAALEGHERPYMKPCGFSEYAFVGTFGETVSKRCCAPADRLRKCEDLPTGIKLIPAGGMGDSNCCPRIAGNRVPQAFLMMMIAAMGGLVSKVLINTFTWLGKQLARKCEWIESKTDDIGMEFVEGLTSMSPTVIVTTVVSYLLGYALSIYSAVDQSLLFGMDGEGWARYQIFASQILGGGAMKAMIGSAASCFVMYFAEQNFNLTGDKDATKRVLEIQSVVLIPLAAVMAPVILTHIIPGIFLYLPLLSLVALLGFGVAFGWMMLWRFAWNSCDSTCARIAIRLLFQFGMLVFVDMATNSVVRVPGEIMVINYGGSDFPYKSVGQDNSGLAAVAGMWHAPFYYMQMASPTCFFRTAFTSADSATQNVLTLLN